MNIFLIHFFSLFSYVIISFFGITSSFQPECKYEDYNFRVVGNIYYCWVQNNLGIFTPESAVIDSETGAHLSSRRNSDIKGFWSDKGGINYFPRGLEKFYPKINYIAVKNGPLKEIHQDDLRNYPSLKVLDLWKNEIEVLEDGLFAYNPDLVYLSFHTNKVCFIAPNIFNHLT